MTDPAELDIRKPNRPASGAWPSVALQVTCGLIAVASMCGGFLGFLVTFLYVHSSSGAVGHDPETDFDKVTLPAGALVASAIMVAAGLLSLTYLSKRSAGN